MIISFKQSGQGRSQPAQPPLSAQWNTAVSSMDTVVSSINQHHGKLISHWFAEGYRRQMTYTNACSSTTESGWVVPPAMSKTRSQPPALYDNVNRGLLNNTLKKSAPQPEMKWTGSTNWVSMKRSCIQPHEEVATQGVGEDPFINSHTMVEKKMPCSCSKKFQTNIGSNGTRFMTPLPRLRTR
jgi:hypothetical protein